MALRSSRLAALTLPWGEQLPMVGRRADLGVLRLLLDDALDGRGHTLLLTGDAGIGKSRLLAALVDEAEARQMQVAGGRGYSVESGVPYGAFADALSAPLRALDPSAVTVLARGTEDELRAIMPVFPGTHSASRAPSVMDSDGKARLLWIVSQFLTRSAARQPLLLVLDNAHWADPSSLELVHFIARQLATARVLIVLAYPEGGADENIALRNVVRSLSATQEATLRTIEPLTQHDLTELLQRTFALPAAEASMHARALFDHTRGNPFFVEETLKALFAAGHIHQQHGTWSVEVTLLAQLPTTIRAAVLTRLEALSPNARRIAEYASLVEGPASLQLLERVSALNGVTFADAIDELCQRRFFSEQRVNGSALYEFSHPILQSLTAGELSAARERALHAALATALEEVHGEHTVAHASEIARHLVRGHELGGDVRALRYLTAASQDALERRADQEAVRWLSDALSIAERLQDQTAAATLLDRLGTARQRLGDSSGAIQAWERALGMVGDSAGQSSHARLLFQLGQEYARAGDAHAGLERLEQAEAAASAEERAALSVRISVARAKTLQALGRHEHAIKTALDALPIAERSGEEALRARVHQTLLQLYAWTGPATEARFHGARALQLAVMCGDRDVEWAAHWAMAMLEGFTGDAAGAARHQRDAARLAEELSSPLLQAMTAEITIEHASAVGRWDDGIALAERMIPLARAVAPQSLLPRLLVWTGVMVLARDETERARALFEEAWRITGAERAFVGDDDSGIELDNVHNVILAHTGMSSYWLARGAWTHAVTYGDRGLALADRFGYVAWAIHRLIPLILEAGLWMQNFDRVEQLAKRLRTQSEALGHRLGLAWATAADALVARLRDNSADAAERILAAADELDAVPFVFHAARLRRKAAQLLEEDGDATGAVRELRRAHDVFAKLGAEFELRSARSQLRSLGVRLPPRTTVQGAGSLTGRELEIARAVANRLSNKEIGASLDISARTVSTHLSNIFEKLGIDSRGALADLMRDDPLLAERWR